MPTTKGAIQLTAALGAATALSGLALWLGWPGQLPAPAWLVLPLVVFLLAGFGFFVMAVAGLPAVMMENDYIEACERDDREWEAREKQEASDRLRAKLMEGAA